MQLNIGQHMRMSQQMKLAPRMIQSMEILQLPVMALQERIEQELAENVCLEVRQNDPEASSDTEVQLELTVTVAPKKEEAAKPALFVGTATGRSGRSARSYEVGDAQEALSDALGEAIAQLLRTEAFVKSLRGER